MMSIIEELWRRGHHPTIVYNTNGYDLSETIRSLEGFVDVWLPDFKYSDDNLAVELSEASNYSSNALEVLKAMVHQVGVTLQTDDYGIARRGIIVRHLVLPGFVQNSTGVLTLISEEISLNLHISLMSQYYPPSGNLLFANSELRLNSPIRKSKIENRKSLLHPITHIEYQKVLNAFHDLGFSHGWLQDFESHQSYRPDFTKKDPFTEI
jgi:putative pyruvate formate lyase activating enzyme